MAIVKRKNVCTQGRYFVTKISIEKTKPNKQDLNQDVKEDIKQFPDQLFRLMLNSIIISKGSNPGILETDNRNIP